MTDFLQGLVCGWLLCTPFAIWMMRLARHQGRREQLVLDVAASLEHAHRVRHAAIIAALTPDQFVECE